MKKLFTLAIFFLGWNALVTNVNAQANPSAGILPANGGVVSLGSILDVKVTITNTKAGNIVAYKLRPNISIPAIATILPNNQQTGLPPGWQIVSNNGTGQIVICNGTDVIGGSQDRDIIIKVQGTTIGLSPYVQVQIGFGGASCAVTGPQPNGNVSADDFASATIEVVPACNLKVNATAGAINCNGETTTINAVATNATGLVEYSITGGAAFQISNVFVNLKAGSYVVTAREITNPTTCAATTSPIVINDPAPVLAPTVSIVQPICAMSNGVMNISSETADLTFSVDESSSYNIYNGGISLASGPHTVRAKNGNNCLSLLTSFIINAQPATPTTPLLGNIKQPDCTVSTGSLVLNGLPTGNWVINPGAITGNTASFTVNALAAGTYNFNVTNDAGCASIPTTAVVITAVAGAPASPSITVIQPSCTVATGSINITSLSVGLTFSLDGGTYQAYPGSNFTGISAGNHSLIAKNISGCLSPFTNFTVNGQPTVPPPPTVNILQPSCSTTTGTITITSSILNSTFSFNNGPFTAYPVGGYTAPSGTYSLAAQNSNGCTPSVTNNIIVNPQPVSPAATLSATPISCSGGNSILTALASGGVLPYEYSLNNGEYQTSNTFDVAEGNYTVTVKDANGCTGVTSSLTIIKPAAILATLSASAIACSGGNSTLTVAASGGTGSFEYSLNNGVYQLSNIFIVTAGTYSVKVRLLTNPACFITTNVITISQPGIFKATSSALPIYYCGGSTVVKIAATGGTSPYTGTGNFDKGPGKWSCIVTDAKGCISSTEIVILPPGCLNVRVSPNPAQNLITVNHSAAFPASAIQIYSVNGVLVLYKSVPQNAFISTIDISTLSSGIYLLVFTNGKDRKEVKFVKTNTY